MAKPDGVDVHAHVFPERYGRKDQERVVRSNAARMLHLV